MTWSGKRFIMFGAVRLRAVWAAWYELFVHSERIRAVTQGVYMLNFVIYCVIQYQSKYIAMCLMLFEKQPIIMCPNSYNHFGTNPMQLIKMKLCGAVPNKMLRSPPKWNVAEPSQMKCCGAVPNEMSLSKNTELSSERKRVNSPWRTDCSSNSQYEFVSNGEGVNYSILLGQCAPLLGVCSGLDGTG